MSGTGQRRYYAGQWCLKCGGGQLLEQKPKHRPGRLFHFRVIYVCPGCGTIYMNDADKVPVVPVVADRPMLL